MLSGAFNSNNLFDLSPISITYNIIGTTVLDSSNFNLNINDRNTLKIEDFNINTDAFIENDVVIFENGVVFSLILRIPFITGYVTNDLKDALTPNTPSIITITETFDNDTNEIVLQSQLVENLVLVITA